MSNSTKIWLIIAASLVVLGLVGFLALMFINDWDFKGLSNQEYETNIYEFDVDFKDISINTDTANIKFIASDNQGCKVVCYEEKNIKHSVAIKDGILEIDCLDNRKWYEHIGINFGNPEITVYLPEGQYNSIVLRDDTGYIDIPDDFQFKDIDISSSTGYVKNYASAETIKVATSTGAIHFENVTAKSISLSVSTGKVIVKDVDCDGEIKIKVSTGKSEITDVKCKSLDSQGDTGDMILENVIVSGKLSVERSTGDVSFDRCDASEIFVETSTGDVMGNLRSGKNFIVTSDTGDVHVPKNTDGGKCEIITDTGDINIKINS